MKAKSPKSSSTRIISNNFCNNLHNNFHEVGILIVSNKFPNWTQVKSTKNFQISQEFDHRHFFNGIFYHKIIFLEFEQGKQPRSFDMGMHGGPSTISIVEFMWISKAHVAATLHKLQKYNPLEGCW